MIHHVYANRSNVGDWLCARGIQQLLGQPVVEHLCDQPFAAGTLAALRQATQQDIIVIGGGGLFMDYFDPFWQGLADLPEGPALCLWGVGCCDLKQQSSLPRLEAIRQLLRRSELCVVRDEVTRRHLAVQGLSTPVACPSICVVEPQEPGWGVLHVDNFSTAGAEVYALMDQSCRVHAKRGNRPYRQTNNRIDPAGERTLFECLRRYRLSDRVVSSALHGCVIAVAMGLPVVAVSGDRKIESFMQAAGLQDWVLDVREVERLPDLLEQLERQRPVPEFTARTRLENAAVAQAVRRIGASRLERPQPAASQ